MLFTFTVVLDPGHGGSNTGAPGARPHTYEKQLTLQLAKRLRARLTSQGIDVYLTRADDHYLTLRGRTRLTNPLHPDLFISLHANASPTHAQRGVEVYVLEAEQAYLEARRRARKESSVPDMLLTQIGLYDIGLRSIRFAESIVRAFVHTALPSTRTLLVKQANYDVLAGIEAPAVLFEVGFIDHPEEGPLLFTRQYQNEIVGRLVEAIDSYRTSLGPVALSARTH